MVLALAGNPNCGKTTLFNCLTGANQRVGNFPGVTVERKEGTVRGTKECTLVDLPGIYSMRAYSNDERVARDFLLKNSPDGLINIVDATSIERSLYLTLQLLEMELPMVLALNMMDEVRANGGSFDVDRLSKQLGIPIVPISAARGEGIEELKNSAIFTAERGLIPKPPKHELAAPLRRCIQAIENKIAPAADMSGLPVRFAAMKLLECEPSAAALMGISHGDIMEIESLVKRMERAMGTDANAAVAAMRYNMIDGLCRACVIRGNESIHHKRSTRIDKVLSDRNLALPVFFLIMVTIFWLTFGVFGPLLSRVMTLGLRESSNLLDRALTAGGASPVIRSFVIEGVFRGIGTVLGFLPVIVVLFFFLCILEDTGYMARVAFVMDSLLRKIGLSGRSMVPLLLGFGCTVPAVMSTRTLSSQRDRSMTIMLTPYMSCSAKIPIYSIFATAFFPKYTWAVMSCLYAAGILAGIIAGVVLKSSVFRGEAIPFVLELPNYRLPSIKTVLLLLWEKSKGFLQRAFTVIFLVTVAIWALQTFDAHFCLTSLAQESMLAEVSRKLSVVFAPLGFSDWRACAALLSGLVAKESVVSTLGILLGDVQTGLESLFTPLAAVSFLTFTLLYTPCVAAIETMRRELGSTTEALSIALLQCLVAWTAAYCVYYVGGLLI